MISSITLGVVFTIAWTAFCIRRWVTREWLTHHCLHTMFLPGNQKNRCCLCLDEWPIRRRPSYECSGRLSYVED